MCVWASLEVKMSATLPAEYVVNGFVVPEKDGDYFRFWCAYCRRWHEHGWPDPDDELTHRCAHCHDAARAPWKRSGYRLHSLGRATTDVLAAIKRGKPLLAEARP